MVLPAADSSYNLCINITKMNSKGMFIGEGDQLSYAFTLLTLQLSISPLIILLTAFLLRPLGIPLMISQIVGGIILGPSFMGHIQNFSKTLFPLRSLLALETIASLGTIFYHFLIALQMDPWMILKTGKKELLIGISVIFVPLVLSLTSSIILMEIFTIDHSVARALPFVGGAESMTAFPVVACFLTELKILNSEFGRVALSSTMVSGLVSFSIVTSAMLTKVTPGTVIEMLSTIAWGAALLILIFFIRSFVLWMIKQNPEGQIIQREVLSFVILLVLVVALLSRLAGLHYLFGPFMFGLALPAGPPLGSEMVKRLDFFTTWMIMPVFFVLLGLEIEVSILQLRNVLIMGLIILISSSGKFIGALLASLHCNMSMKDALSLGLTMTVQGVLELSMFKTLRDIKLIDNASFVLMSIMMLFVTGGVTPIIRFLYNSRRYSHRRRTILHLEPKTEFRMLVCIQNQENVPAMIHLLKASNPMIDSRIKVYVLHLVELAGRANPLFITHEKHKSLSFTRGNSGRIVNVFRRFEEQNIDSMSVKPYTAVSPFTAMHNDVCSMAFNKKTSLIIIPFHKQQDINGRLFSPNIGFKTVNQNILNKAPCSVGILLDRGLLGGFRFVFASWLTYHISVLFLGGVDDHETLAYGARMSKHPTISFTVVRVVSGTDTKDYMAEREQDDEVVSDLRRSMAGNDQFVYREEVASDFQEFRSVTESMESDYQLIMVGRNHDPELLFMFGLEWNDAAVTELGVVGDIIGSDAGGKSTLLVVQQQRQRRKQETTKHA